MKKCPECGKIYYGGDDYYCHKDNRRLVECETEYYKPATEKSPPNTPKCPSCGSSDLRKISSLNRATSIAFWGLASSKIGKQFECKSCGYKW